MQNLAGKTCKGAKNGMDGPALVQLKILVSVSCTSCRLLIMGAGKPIQYSLQSLILEDAVYAPGMAWKCWDPVLSQSGGFEQYQCDWICDTQKCVS